MEISEAASFKLKLEKPSVSSSHCLSSTTAVVVGNGFMIKSNEILSVKQPVLLFVTLTKIDCWRKCVLPIDSIYYQSKHAQL